MVLIFQSFLSQEQDVISQLNPFLALVIVLEISVLLALKLGEEFKMLLLKHGISFVNNVILSHLGRFGPFAL